MDMQIPDCEIVENVLAIVIHDDPNRVLALTQISGLSTYVAGETRFALLDFIGLRLSTDGGEAVECGIDLLGMPRPTLVVTLPNPAAVAESRYLLLRDDSIGGQQQWSCSDRLLVLPEDNPGEWGDDERGFEQREGRILVFAGMANINGWFAPVEIEVLPEGI